MICFTLAKKLDFSRIKILIRRAEHFAQYLNDLLWVCNTILQTLVQRCFSNECKKWINLIKVLRKEIYSFPDCLAFALPRRKLVANFDAADKQVCMLIIFSLFIIFVKYLSGSKFLHFKIKEFFFQVWNAHKRCPIFWVILALS